MAGRIPRIYRHMSHPGEEPPVSGSRGSGTVFFSHCTMACAYCQNYRMSQRHEGRDTRPAALARMMESLAEAGCHNLNLVSATQHLPGVLEALVIADDLGVSLPIVWNTSGYESAETLALLDGVVDIYLADIRYSSEESAARLSDTPGYVASSRSALREMRRQVGVLETDHSGVARRGLIVRHLVLPNDLAGTREALSFVASELGRDTFVSLMAQYYPAHRAPTVPGIERALTSGEWDAALQALADAGLENGWAQELPRGLPDLAGTLLDPDPESEPHSDPDPGY